MNERIRELAEQARLVSEGQPSGSSPYYDALDKFARLIVRECSRIADGWVDNDDDGKNYPSEMIKQHFGVEP
jgi:hypothetical protein